MSEEITVYRKLKEIENSYEEYILSAIEHDADKNRMARFKTRIEDQIIKIYTDHPGYKDTIIRELFLIKKNTFDVYFDGIGLNYQLDAKIINAGEKFNNMAIKYHDQLASASCNSTRTLGGKKKNKTKTKKKNKSKTRRRSRI